MWKPCKSRNHSREDWIALDFTDVPESAECITQILVGKHNVSACHLNKISEGNILQPHIFFQMNHKS